MSGFTKLFSSIVTSTIWREPAHVCKVWITMLAIADKHGIVEGSVPGLADLARVSLDECVAALDRFRSPDPWSRTQEHDGRRIEDIRGGWRLLNYAYYRDMHGKQDDDLSMSPEAIRKRRQRERERAEAVTSVTPRDSSVTPSASASTSEARGKGEVQEGGDRAFQYALRLTVAANKGLAQPIPRILPTSGSSRQAAEIVCGADIPLEFAEQVVFERASGLTPEVAAEVRSLAYFTRAVVEAWQRQSMTEAMAASGLRRRGMPKRVRRGVCPECALGDLGPGEWEPHFRIKHPRLDVPSFAENSADASA